jgi:hypothetical protein
MKTKQQIQEIIDLVQPYLDEETFLEEDEDIWQGIVKALMWVIDKHPVFERAILVLRTANIDTPEEPNKV